MKNNITIILLLFITLSCIDEKLELGEVNISNLSANLENDTLVFYFLGLDKTDPLYEIYLQNYSTKKISNIKISQSIEYNYKTLVLSSSELILNKLKIKIKGLKPITIHRNYGQKYCVVTFEKKNNIINLYIYFSNSEIDFKSF